jgi:hypothetical protein
MTHMGPLVPAAISLVLALFLGDDEPHQEEKPLTCPLPLLVPPLPAEHWLGHNVTPAQVPDLSDEFGMFDLFSSRHPPSPEHLAALARAKEEELRTAIDWSMDIKWQPRLVVKASSWPTYDLFPDLPVLPAGTSNTAVEAMVKGLAPELDQYAARSPSGRFVYAKRILPRGHSLSINRANSDGTVKFDGDVVIPIVFERRYVRDDQGNVVRERDPVLWMSHTPFEIFTLRDGVKKSKGHTVVAGLGLGWQLAQIASRKKVSGVTLVEFSQELVDWILPRIVPLLPQSKVEVRVGDAYRVLPTLEADVAIVDIWPTYTDIGMDLARMEGCSAGIKEFWGWGYGWKTMDYSYYVSQYRKGRWKNDR